MTTLPSPLTSGCFPAVLELDELALVVSVLAVLSLSSSPHAAATSDSTTMTAKSQRNLPLPIDCPLIGVGCCAACVRGPRSMMDPPLGPRTSGGAVTPRAYPTG